MNKKNAYEIGKEDYQNKSIIDANFRIEGYIAICNKCNKRYSKRQYTWIIKHSIKHEIYK